MVGEMAVVLSGRTFGLASLPPPEHAGRLQQHQGTGALLYTTLLSVEIASVILLVAIIAAVMADPAPAQDTRTMHPSDQIAVKAKDRMRLVKMRPNRTSRCRARKGSRHDLAFGLPDPRRHLSPSAWSASSSTQEPDRAADGHRTDAAGSEYQFFVAFSHYLNDLSASSSSFHSCRGCAESGIGLAICGAVPTCLQSMSRSRQPEGLVAIWHEVSLSGWFPWLPWPAPSWPGSSARSSAARSHWYDNGVWRFPSPWSVVIFRMCSGPPLHGTITPGWNPAPQAAGRLP